MYNDELDMILESAYEDGYYQALADMGYEFDDDEASEDVDIFDDNYFDDVVESSRARYDSEGKPLNNKARKNDHIIKTGHEYNRRWSEALHGDPDAKPISDKTARGLGRGLSRTNSTWDKNKYRRLWNKQRGTWDNPNRSYRDEALSVLKN